MPYIVLKLQLPSPWPISDIFVPELDSACRVAKANTENLVLQSKSPEAVKAVSTHTPNSMAPAKIPKADVPLALYVHCKFKCSKFEPISQQPGEMYSGSHRVVKGSRVGHTRLSSTALSDSTNQNVESLAVKSSVTVASQPNDERELPDNVKSTPAELLFGEAAGVSLLTQKTPETAVKYFP